MKFQALGELRAAHDGVVVDLGPARQRAVFALLLIHRNETLTADRILDEIWREDGDGKLNALRVHVSRLRAALDPDRSRGAPSVLETVGSGYRLNVEPEQFDVDSFEAELETGRTMLDGDREGARAMLERALSRWRGEPYEDFPYAEFVQVERRRLLESRADAFETRIGLDLALGRAGSVLSELELLREQYPLRERFVEHQARALYLVGRSADALRAIERFRRHIADEAGLDPSPELLRLEEQILLHDERLRPRNVGAGPDDELASSAAANPYLGLHPFGADDAGRFFGRDTLIADILRTVRGGQRLVAVVGASGSGKSSVVRAGVVPALAKGAIEGSDRWLIATMVPGAHPFIELAAALTRASATEMPVREPRADGDDRWLLGAALRILPDESSRLVLVIDQFEELFTLCDDADERNAFLSNLVMALDDPHQRVVVIVALRADFYAQPLAHPEFGTRLGAGVVNVTPLTAEELAVAARLPAEHVGATLEPALLGQLIADVGTHTGALPLFQYALTELFERRDEGVLTLASYRSMGGLEGALRRRADDLLDELDDDQREAARQLFLRLVRVMDDGELVGRRTAASEVVSLDVDTAALAHVIGVFGRHRILAFDSDQLTGSPTVEIAHEALLTAWPTLASWIDQSRDDLRRHASLATAVREWHLARRDAAYLWGPARLDDLDQWTATSGFTLNAAEREFVAASRSHAEQLRADHEMQRRSAARSRRLLVASGAALVAMFAVIGVLALGVFDDGDTPIDDGDATIDEAEIAAESERVAAEFLAAVNDRDPEGGDQLLAPGAQISISPVSPLEAVSRGISLGDQIAWRTAWDWRWDVENCVAVDTSTAVRIEQPQVQDRPEGMVAFDNRVTCRLVVSRNKLSDLDNAALAHTVDVRLLSGDITYAYANVGDLRWMPSFLDFKEWAETERSEQWVQAWDDSGPLLTLQSAEVEGRLLDEYIALATER